MKQYIDKVAIVAEIDRLIEIARAERMLYPKTILSAKNLLLLEDYDRLKKIIDKIDVKEVDFDKEYKEFVEEDPVYNKLVNGIVGKAIAKHFFELGLK